MLRLLGKCFTMSEFFILKTLSSCTSEIKDGTIFIYFFIPIYVGNVYSPPTRACLWILRTYNIPHHFEVVDIWGGGTDTEDFKKLNPVRFTLHL